MLRDVFGVMSIRMYAKIDSNMITRKPNVSITSMMQPECIIPWMRARSDQSGSWNRFQIVAPFVHF